MLGSPRHQGERIDPWQFFAGRKLTSPGPLTLPLLLAGHQLDYTMADYGVPIVSEACADVLREAAADDVQLFPIEVEGQPSSFYVANATKLADCVDETRSEEVKRWTEADGRPDRLGEYKSIGVLRVDPERVGGLQFFRIERYRVALIVSETLKHAMERAKLVGPKFKPV
jgi:hypothetical protein